MRSLSFDVIKRRIVRREREDRLLRRRILNLLGSDFLFREINFDRKKIALVAASKAAAQELFMKRELLEDELGKKVFIK